MKLFILCIVILTTACGIGLQNSSYRSTSRQCGPDGRCFTSERIQEGHGDAVSLGLPISVGTGSDIYSSSHGYHSSVYPYMTVTSIPQIVTTPIMVGGSSGAGLEKRVSKVERQTKLLGKSHRSVVKQIRKTNKRVGELEKNQKVLIKWQRETYYLNQHQCKKFKGDSSLIKDDDLKVKVVNGCNKLLGVNSEGGNDE